mgnify:FL=1
MRRGSKSLRGGLSWWWLGGGGGSGWEGVQGASSLLLLHCVSSGGSVGSISAISAYQCSSVRETGGGEGIAELDEAACEACDARGQTCRRAPCRRSPTRLIRALRYDAQPLIRFEEQVQKRTEAEAVQQGVASLPPSRAAMK